MYCIGVTGRCGAGKTEFSYHLHEEFPQSVLIHADPIMHNAILSEKDLLIKLYGNNIIINGKLNKQLYMSDDDNISIIETTISPKIQTTIMSQINELASTNQNLIIIIDWFRLPDCTELWQNCKTKILIKSIDDNLRWFHMNQRTGMTSYELSLRDKMIDHDSLSYDIIITNNYDNSLIKEAKRIAKKIIL